MNIQQKLGFDKIISLFKNHISSELGKSLIDEIVFETDVEKIKTHLIYIDEFKNILQNDNLSVDNLYDIRENLNIIKVENTFLNQDEILKLWKSLNGLQVISAFFKIEDNSEKYPKLSKKCGEIKIYRFIFDLIKRILTKEGEIKNNASKNLKDIRADILAKESQVSGIIRRAFNDAKNQGILDDDANVSVRNGRMLVPVNAMYKNKLQGIVQDYSSTGRTVYIEPLKSVELNNEIRNLYFEEKREITKILIEFTNEIRPYIDDLLLNYRFLAEIDFIRAKAKFALELDCEMPKITDKPEISLRYAQHPLLFHSFRKLNKNIVPLDLELVDNQNVMLISGPNAGGKSIAVKTVGLLQYMVQCGFLVPVKKTSKFGVFNEIFVDIGDDQSIDNDLSTYSSHLMNMKNIIENATEKSLVIIDEFGSGTDPAMGGAIAEAILEALLKTNAKAVINTHYSNLKHFATQQKSIVNAAMLFDREKLKPLYLLEVGRPGSSFAFEIAKNIGLSQEIIENAKNKAGKNVINFDKIIGEMEQQAKKLRKTEYELNKTKKELADKVEIYRNQREKLVRERRKIISEAEKKVDEILKNSNKIIERTIKEIRTKQADKEQVKRIRREFENKKSSIKNAVEKEKKIIEIEEQIIEQKKKKVPKKKIVEKINIGDFVIAKKSGLKGKVEAIKDDTAMIIAGTLRTFVKINQLEKIGEDRSQKKVKVNIQMAETKQDSLVFSLDVRGKRTEAALQKVEKYIDNALITETKSVSILHGTGDGILRNFIRQYLKTIDEIEWFGDGDIRTGGAGITQIIFK